FRADVHLEPERRRAHRPRPLQGARVRRGALRLGVGGVEDREGLYVLPARAARLSAVTHPAAEDLRACRDDADACAARGFRTSAAARESAPYRSPRSSTRFPGASAGAWSRRSLRCARGGAERFAARPLSAAG